MAKQLTILCVTLIVMLTGCAKRNVSLPSNNLPNLTQPVDANQNGVIDLDDVEILAGRFNECYEGKVKPFLDKAGLISNGKVNTENVKDTLKNTLTTSEYDEFMKLAIECNQLHAQVNATGKALGQDVQR